MYLQLEQCMVIIFMDHFIDHLEHQLLFLIDWSNKPSIIYVY